MKTILTLFIAITLLSCKESNTNSASVMTIEIDGVTHHFKTIDWSRSTVDFGTEVIHIELLEEGNPVSFNLHVHDMGILEKSSGDYTLPDDNKTGPTIYLDFFNKEREGRKANRRIGFAKGDIEIKQLSKDKLDMTFNGEGNGMMETGDLFSIKGHSNVDLQKQ
ncbi:MAG: hypothetical protein HKP42_06650 [Maribacter sp.]|nr:hypothetical protein [Maribacter sp.]